MENGKICRMPFEKAYGLPVQKAQRKGRAKEEVDELAKGRPMAKILRQKSAQPQGRGI